MNNNNSSKPSKKESETSRAEMGIASIILVVVLIVSGIVFSLYINRTNNYRGLVLRVLDAQRP